MAKLREVLGGVLRDVTESRVAADLAAAEYFDLYQKDPVLAHLPIPRMAVKDLSLRLRFAVEDHPARPSLEDLEGALGRLWRTEVIERVVPKVLEAVLKRPVPPERAAELAKALAEPIAGTRFRLTDLSREEVAGAAEAAVTRLLAGMKKLPVDVRRELPSERALRGRIERSVKERLAAVTPRLRQLSAARQTAQLDLDVLVKRADLTAVQESAIQEVTITITMDDVHVAEAPPAPSEKA